MEVGESEIQKLHMGPSHTRSQISSQKMEVQTDEGSNNGNSFLFL
jgi:hypothetical protein